MKYSLFSQTSQDIVQITQQHTDLRVSANSMAAIIMSGNGRRSEVREHSPLKEPLLSTRLYIAGGGRAVPITTHITWSGLVIDGTHYNDLEGN